MVGVTALTILVVMSGSTIIGRELDIESDIRQLEVLGELGHRVTCVAPANCRWRGSRIVRDGLELDIVLIQRVVPGISMLIFQLRALRRIIRALNRCDALILHIYSVPLVFPLLLITRMVGRSPALFLRLPTNPVETGDRLRTFAFHKFFDLALKLAAVIFDKIFFISPMLGQLYIEKLRLSKKKVGVWPSPVEMRLFNQLHATKAKELRKELALSNRLSVLYHGALTRSRGLMELVEAFGILKTQNVKATLVLLGDGPAKEEARRFVEAHDLKDFVLFCPSVEYSQVPDYIAACDVGISPLPDHPWWRYQCPTKVLECLAMNKPLILSDIPAHRWIVGNAPVALYLKGTSASEIATSVIEFLAVKDKIDSTLGREVSRRFSTEVIAKMLEFEIDGVLKNRMMNS